MQAICMLTSGSGGYMEIKQLRYLVAIARYGSLSKASRKVYVAQSALSHQLAKLEQELNTRLFIRMPRGVELTEAGHVFLTHATSILRQVDEAKASVRGSLGQPGGRVNVGMPSSICNALAMPLFKEAKAALPGVELELTEAATGDLADQLRTGSVNIAILFDDGDTSQFLTRTLVDEQLYLVGKASNNNVTGDAVSLKEALQLPLFMASAKQGVRRIVEQAAIQNGLRPANVVAEINSVNIMKSALMAKQGYTILPPMAVWHEVEAGMLQAWPIEQPVLYRKVVICVSKNIPMTPAILAIYNLAERVAHSLCASGRWIKAAPCITDNQSVEAG